MRNRSRKGGRRLLASVAALVGALHLAPAAAAGEELLVAFVQQGGTGPTADFHRHPLAEAASHGGGAFELPALPIRAPGHRRSTSAPGRAAA